MNSGIYKITSISKNRIYIGSSINIKRRWINHINKLRNNKHANIKLQRHYNKYGESDLKFEVILYCDKEMLITLEQKQMDIQKPWFNINQFANNALGRKCTQKQLDALKIGGTDPEVIKRRTASLKGRKHSLSPEALENFRKLRKLRVLTTKQLENMRNSSHAKSISQYDLNYNLIKEWHCVKCASKELNISESSIRQCAKKIRKTAGNFIWHYK